MIKEEEKHSDQTIKKHKSQISKKKKSQFGPQDKRKKNHHHQKLNQSKRGGGGGGTRESTQGKQSLTTMILELSETDEEKKKKESAMDLPIFSLSLARSLPPSLSFCCCPPPPHPGLSNPQSQTYFTCLFLLLFSCQQLSEWRSEFLSITSSSRYFFVVYLYI